MIKRILELSKIFIKDYFQNLNIFNKNTKKINIKSVFVWLLIILILALSYLSYKIIDYLNGVGQAILFLKIYFPIVATIFMFQAILICSNVFYFSKDLEYILPLPIKPIELLIAKFNNVISIIYGTELIFLGIPLIIYGLLVSKSLIYFLSIVLVLILFPILPVIIINLIMLFVMQLTKFIKNKDIFQIILVLIITIILSCAEGYLLKNIFNDNIIEVQITENSEIENAKINTEILNLKLNKINNYFIFINPCIKMLTELKIINILIQLLKLILINIFTFLIFIYFGKKLYLKNLLKNIAYINKKKINEKNTKNKYKKNKINKIYIKNELKKIIKNPTFFIQCIFQNIFIVIILLLIFNAFMPIILDSFTIDTITEIGIDNFKLQVICIVLGFVQMLFTINNLSITAISREGKNAIFMKYIPVPLYKQFIYKSIPQILINTFMILGVLGVIYIHVQNISIIYFLITFLVAMILNIINSYLMLIINFKKPNFDWITETSVFKDNGNKLYQYVTTIIIILFIMYLVKIFDNISIKISLPIIILVFLIILLIVKKYIKKNINKLFNKIN